MTNTTSVNITSTVSINSDDEKERYKMDWYILHTFLLIIILLFTTAIVCHHYENHRPKQKTYWCANNIKTRNNKLKKRLY